MLSSGQDFGKKFVVSKHILKVYFKPSRKKPDLFFIFSTLLCPYPNENVPLLRPYFIPKTMLIIYFRLGINSPHTFFDMAEARKVNAGRHTTFSIKPFKVVTDETIGLTTLQRNCRFHDEIPDNMTLFNNYSMAACKFECILMIR